MKLTPNLAPCLIAWSAWFLCFPASVAEETKPTFAEILREASEEKGKVTQAFERAQSAIKEDSTPLEQVKDFTDVIGKTAPREEPPIGFRKFGSEEIARNQQNAGSIYNDPVYIRNAAKVANGGANGRAFSFGPRAGVVTPPEFNECVSIGRSGSYEASGVIIDRDLVLTCAHIWDGNPKSAPDSVWLGSVTPNCSVARRKGKFLAVKRVIRHPGYIFEGDYREPRGNDLMLLEIDPAYRMNIEKGGTISNLAPIDKISNEDLPSVRAVGFGNSYLDVDGEPGGFGVKREVSIPIASLNPGIYGLHVDTREGTSVVTEFVAASKSERSSSCTGDSGGPVYFNNNGLLEIIGITSRRTPDATVKCGDGAIYTIVPYFSEWIKAAAADANRSTWTLVE